MTDKCLQPSTVSGESTRGLGTRETGQSLTLVPFAIISRHNFSQSHIWAKYVFSTSRPRVFHLPQLIPIRVSQPQGPLRSPKPEGPLRSSIYKPEGPLRSPKPEGPLRSSIYKPEGPLRSSNISRRVL